MNTAHQQNASADALTEKLESVIRRLSLTEGPGLVRSWEDYHAVTKRHIVRQAFENINAQAIFGFSGQDSSNSETFCPIMYLCKAPNDESAKGIHRLVWSQGIVPLLLIATPGGLQVLRSLAPPPKQPITVAWDQLATDRQLPTELTSLTSVSLLSSIVWRDFMIDRSSRVDKALLDGITSLGASIQLEDIKLRRETIHALIGRFLYFYILFDRKIIDENWISNLVSKNGGTACPTIAISLIENDALAVWPANEVWELFDQIDSVMNGAIFPITISDRNLFTDHILHLVHRVIRHGDKVSAEGHQLSFLHVSFETLRTETISAIYEHFLSLESDGKQSDDGAFYTPPFLADYILDEVDSIEPFTEKSLVLDPTAGSGVFLVGAYRRLIERNITSDNWAANDFRKARHFLEHNIYGIERNRQASNVCKFSLYLTLLDYARGATVTKLAKVMQGDRVFPPLNESIISADAFTVSPEANFDGRRFTHVIGNPPWGTFGRSASRTNQKRGIARQEKIDESSAAAIKYHGQLNETEFPVTNKRLSELFIWKIKLDFLRENGVLGMLVSTRSFVGRSAVAFPDALAKHFELKGLANLSHFRYRLFPGARSPTAAIFARNLEPNPLDKIWVYSPLLSSQPIGEKGYLWSIIVNSQELETHRIRDLTTSKDGWFNHLILRPLDRKYAKNIATRSYKRSQTLERFLDTHGLKISRGGSPSQTGLPDRLLLKAGSLGTIGGKSLGFTSYPHNEIGRFDINHSFKDRFSGNILLIPRSMNEVKFVEKPIGFSSTFNAIYASDQKAAYSNRKAMQAIGAYLKSDVAAYFFAILGKTWFLDHARLEKNDLLAIPFPFNEKDDQGLSTLLSSDQDLITEEICSRMGFDTSFVDIVREYSDFRIGYEDCQLPKSSLQRPDDDEINRYRSMLIRQFGQMFGTRAKIDVGPAMVIPDTLFFRVQVRIGVKGVDFKSRETTASSETLSLGQFTPYTSIQYEVARDRILLDKPITQAAWTIEQAYADARAVSATILRVGKAA